MAESNRCSSCLVHFDSSIRIPITLPCSHQVCQICILEQYSKEGSNQCPKRECKKVSFFDAKSLISQKNQSSESKQENKQLYHEETKIELVQQQKTKLIKINILIENIEEINLNVEEGETIQQLKQKVERLEGIDSDFYELYREQDKLDSQHRINKMENKEEIQFYLKFKDCNQYNFQEVRKQDLIQKVKNKERKQLIKKLVYEMMKEQQGKYYNNRMQNTNKNQNVTNNQKQEKVRKIQKKVKMTLSQVKNNCIEGKFQKSM